MHAADVALSVLLAAIIVVSLLANVLVLVCFVYNAEIRRQVPGLFVLNLTCCNLLLASSNMPLTVAGLLGHAPPPGGHVLCQLAAFLDTFLTSNSMLSMAALSIDRWVAVVFPLSYHSRMRRRDAVLALAYAWLHSLGFAVAPACLSWLDYHRPTASCTLYSPEARASSRAHFAAYTVALHALTFLLVLVVLCVTYLKVLQVARFHCKRIDVITMQTLVLLVDIHPSVRQRCLEEQRKRRQRATRKISTFIGTFVICFTPYVLTRVVELFVAVPISPYWGVLCKSLAYSKAACDPFVYSLLRHQYRQTCRDIINRFLKRRSLNTSGQRQENGKVKKPVNSGKSEISEIKPEKPDKEGKTGTGSAV
ncbi:G-protein coupled receptor 26 [Pygocentrus nattereri]|uniref:G-protein coupled receptors family 1 profile domain-containing protein n=1 Tax=Pygocentrus nattereri TaxID=42514 RepID=A0AAR2LS22_PYGNA|nr:G-protein coupled receptor 26 [Pygocentrus nattereri]